MRYKNIYQSKCCHRFRKEGWMFLSVKRAYCLILIGLIISLTVLICQIWYLYFHTDTRIVHKRNEMPVFLELPILRNVHKTRHHVNHSLHKTMNREEIASRRPKHQWVPFKLNQSVQPPKRTTKIIPTWIKQKWVQSLQGHLNVHIWLYWCGSTISDLRRNIHFPKFPDIHLKTPVFYLSHDAHNYGQRVFGYLHPPKTGMYTFAVSSDDSSELWLSTDNDPTNSKLIAWVGNRTDTWWTGATGNGEFHKYPFQISRNFFLHRNRRYFIEALHKQSSTSDHLLVAWQLPKEHRFRYITSKRISLYLPPEDEPNFDVIRYSQHIPLSPATLEPALVMRSLLKRLPDDTIGDTRQTYTNTIRSIAFSVFPTCNFTPSYLVDFTVRRFQGVTLVHETAIFPYDNTNLYHMNQYSPCMANTLVDSHGKYLPKKNGQNKHGNRGNKRKNRVKHGLPGTNGGNQGNQRNIMEDHRRNTLDVGGNQDFSVDDGDNRDSNMDNKEPQGDLEASISRILALSGEQSKVNIHRNMSRKFVLPNISKTQELISWKKKENSTVREKFIKRKLLSVNASAVSHDKRKTFMNNSSHVRSEHLVLHRDNLNSTREPQGHDGLQEDNLNSTREPEGHKGLQEDNLNRTREQQYDRVHVGAQWLTRDHVNVKWGSEQGQTEDNAGHDGIARNSSETIKNKYTERTYENSGDKLVDNGIKLLPPKKLLIEYEAGKKSKDIVDEVVEELMITGEWELIEKYVKEKDLVFTTQTLQYVLWKYFHYRKPAPKKILGYIYLQNADPCRLKGNVLLNKDVVKAIVLKYLETLRDHYSRGVSLKRIVNVEENHDVIYGDRYLIEVDVLLSGEDKIVRFSDYVYLPLGEKSFCQPQNFVWKTTTNVHVIVPVKNQGKWVQHFINDISELYEKTLDQNFNVIIVDFGSTDIDIQHALDRSSLKRYQVLKAAGSFQRALGVQLGANAVENPNDILFTCDLHLEMPNNMIEIIRKHCVQGKMAFSPMVLRLGCGFTPSLPYGEWETFGYGLFAIYQSDFVRIGGMNHEEFKTHWGGEDWEMVDRFLQSRMEIARLRVPKFYHYYHGKTGLWGSSYHDVISDHEDMIQEDHVVPFHDPNKELREEYRHNHLLSP